MEKEPQNVYEMMQSYYDEYDELTYFTRDLTESFIRQKAWQGEPDEQLQRIWEQIQLFELYIMHKQLEALALFTAEDYLYSAYWLASEQSDYAMQPDNIPFYFDVLVEFVQTIQDREKQLIVTPVLQAKQMLDEGADVFAFEEENNNRLSSRLPDSDDDTEEDHFEWALLDIVEQAIEYFSDNPSFRHDYIRSMSWFHGLMDSDESDELSVETWHDYWYYFLFEYHLLQTDQRPIAYYVESVAKQDNEFVSADALLRSQFVLFHIERQPIDDNVTCQNLLANEVFTLPEPEMQFPWLVLRQQIFFGHRYCCDGIFGGRFSSAQVSARLRNRIKAEMRRLLSLFRLQQPNATWYDLLERHSLSIRYMLETFVRFNQLTVFPTELPVRAVMASVNDVVEAADPIETELMKLVGASTCFSQFDWRIAVLLWRDYCLTKTVPSNADQQATAWAVAILSLYNDNNKIVRQSVALQAKLAQVDKEDVGKKRLLITHALQLNIPDFRYLNECGYVHFLTD